MCPKKHLSPRTAQHCILCGADRLSEPTTFLALGWLATLIGLAMTSGIIWAVWSYLTESTKDVVPILVHYALFLAVMLYIIRAFMGKNVWNGLWRACQMFARVVSKAVWLIWQVLDRLLLKR
jgi:hypothetical protein